MSVGAHLGVEEEFLLVEAEGFAPLAAVEEVLPLARRSAGELAQHELHEAQIETATTPCSTLAEVDEQLRSLRRTTAEAARSRGGLLVASGTYPGVVEGAGRKITDDDRYAEMVGRFGELTRDQIVCGCHVHVEFDDAELAVAAMNRSRRWLAVVLAVGANSPFSSGRDTGYASFRTEVWSRWPSSGPPGEFASRADYDELVGRLVASGVLLDEAMSYFDVRPSKRYPTLEFRVSDVTLRVEHAVLVAGLFRALAVTSARAVAAGAPPEPLRHELLRAAQWRAARSGLEGELVDPLDGTRLAAPAMLERLVAHVGEALEEHGDAALVGELVGRVLAEGNGASIQREMVARPGGFDTLLGELARATTA